MINIKPSFKNYTNLQSLSCWFIPAYAYEDGKPKCMTLFPLQYNDAITGLENINTSHISNVQYMFGGYQTFYNRKNNDASYEMINLSGFDLEHNLKNIDGMFANLYKLNGINFGSEETNSKFTTTNVTSMVRTFYGCHFLHSKENALTTILENLDVSKVTNMSYMFADSGEYDLTPTEMAFVFPASFDTTKVTNMSYMFSGLKASSIRINSNLMTTSSFNTSNVVSMKGMFSDCSLKSLDIGGSNFTTANVKDMSYMFAYNTELQDTAMATSYGRPNFVVKAAEDISYMFFGCNNLVRFKLNFDPSCSIKDARFMCSARDLNSGMVFIGDENRYVATYLRSLRSFDLTNMHLDIQEFDNQYVDVLFGYYTTYTYTGMMNYYITQTGSTEGIQEIHYDSSLDVNISRMVAVGGAQMALLENP
ncbi:MAG: BspA family leucine-rich repeat surface protein [Coriobacteriia bacterium]|nr:BspA family leucine-rich repeat surface protein [Coriobacteriia bacterium]